MGTQDITQLRETSGHEHPLPRPVWSPHLASLPRLLFLLWAPFPRVQWSPATFACSSHTLFSLEQLSLLPHLPIPLAGSVSIGQAEMTPGKAGASMCPLPFMIPPKSPSHPQNEKHGSAPHSIWQSHGDLAIQLLIGRGL